MRSEKGPAGRSLSVGCCCLAVVLVGCANAGEHVGRAGSAKTQSPRPFFDARAKTAEYVGPGREDPAPAGLAAVKIGWFGPYDPDHPTGGDPWRAACLAVEEANEAGGCGGIPFVLVPAWSENPWGTGVRDVTRLVYDEKVWAIAGAPDGPSAHLVEQVVAKARLAFVSPVSTDATTNLANVPWIFSFAPSDHRLAPVLAQAITARAGPRGLVVVSCTDHDSRMTTTALLASLSKRKVFPKRHITFRPGSGDFAAQLTAIRTDDPGAVAVIAGPTDSARFVSAIRQAGIRVPVFGGPAMGRRVFAEQAGRFTDGVVFPRLWDADARGEPAKRFAARFHERFGVRPDYAAAYTYDAMRLLMAAVAEARPNRTRIRDALRRLSGWEGVTGTVSWDGTGQNHGVADLGTCRGSVPEGRPPSYGQP